MKRIDFTFLLFMLMSMVGAQSYAYDAKIDGIYYNFSGNEATVTHSHSGDAYDYDRYPSSYYSDYYGNIVIPESVTYEGRNYKVTKIGHKAFCTTYSLSVTIPKSIKKIEKFALLNVTAIYISDLTAWLNIDFSNYYWTDSRHRLYLNGQEIRDLIIPTGRTDINLAFRYCSSLISVTIPEGITSIKSNCFYGCSNLKSIMLPSTLEWIGRDAFCDCSSLISVTIPEGVSEIGMDCFRGCSNLKRITLPSTLEEIGYFAFNNCNAIETIYSNIYRVFALPTDITYFGSKVTFFEQIVYDNAVLYVPAGTKTKYQQIQGWKKFLNIRENTVDITISNAGYSTFYSSQFSYVLPNGLSAQVVTKASNGKLTYRTIADGNTAGIVPKGTAVILASQGGRVGIYTLTPTLNDTSYSGTNLLQGSDEITTTTGNGYHYKLSFGKTGTIWDNVFGWYWGAQNGAPFQIEGNKAWLVVPSGSTRAEAFAIDGDATEIKGIEPDESSEVYYDIQGRRVSTPTNRGLYIKNGKKVVIK